MTASDVPIPTGAGDAGIRKIALGVGTATVQRIKAEMSAAA
jgi:hypothetical protein